MAFIRCEHCGHRIEVRDFKILVTCPACKCVINGELLARGRVAFSLSTAISVVLATGLIMLLNFRGQTMVAGGHVYGWPVPAIGDSFFMAMGFNIMFGLAFALGVGWFCERRVRRASKPPPVAYTQPLSMSRIRAALATISSIANLIPGVVFIVFGLALVFVSVFKTEWLDEVWEENWLAGTALGACLSLLGVFAILWSRRDAGTPPSAPPPPSPPN